MVPALDVDFQLADAVAVLDVGVEPQGGSARELLARVLHPHLVDAVRQALQTRLQVKIHIRSRDTKLSTNMLAINNPSTDSHLLDNRHV